MLHRRTVNSNISSPVMLFVLFWSMNCGLITPGHAACNKFQIWVLIYYPFDDFSPGPTWQLLPSSSALHSFDLKVWNGAYTTLGKTVNKAMAWGRNPQNRQCDSAHRSEEKTDGSTCPRVALFPSFHDTHTTHHTPYTASATGLFFSCGEQRWVPYESREEVSFSTFEHPQPHQFKG